ncbi:MAG: hypothetical protein GY953_22025, partial [bacterium]|nr:hypothetical protein [bacterium]
MLALAVAVGACRSLDTTAKVDGGELFVPRAEQIRFGTFGFDAVLSDYYWLMALQLVGGNTAGTAEGGVVASLID